MKTAAVLALILGIQESAAQTFPALPNAAKIADLRDDIPYTSASCDHSPLTSAALTTAIANATAGQTICLQAGSTYVGTFILNKSNAQYITIRSTAIANLPAGVRVDPGDVDKLATILATPRAVDSKSGQERRATASSG